MSAPVQNSKLQSLVQSRVHPAATGAAHPRPSAGAPDFSAVLNDRLKVSSHAQTRLQSRDIQLDQGAWERVMQGVEKAAEKGAKESLVMVDDVALIVSVKNRTVITAVDQAKLKDNVFTNIDSAIIV